MIVGALVTVACIVLSASFHEAAHAWVADRCGDPTARLLGRVTLNPIKHIDPLWSIVFPLMLYIGTNGQFMFGMAKPVPVEVRNLRSPRWHNLLVSAAGPFTNVLLAVAAALLLIPLGPLAAPGTVNAYIVGHLVMVNITLAAFNLLPIPPLDGSHVLEMLAPRRVARWIRDLRPYGFMILAVVLLTGADKPYMEFTGLAALRALALISPNLLPVLLAIVQMK